MGRGCSVLEPACRGAPAPGPHCSPLTPSLGLTRADRAGNSRWQAHVAPLGSLSLSRGWAWRPWKPSAWLSFNSLIKKILLQFDASVYFYCHSLESAGLRHRPGGDGLCFTRKLNGTVMGTLGHFRCGPPQQPDPGFGVMCECGPHGRPHH